MLISFRTSSASHFDKLPLQPPDGSELIIFFSATSGEKLTYLKSTKKKYRLPPGIVTVTWNLTCSFSKTKLQRKFYPRDYSDPPTHLCFWASSRFEVDRSRGPISSPPE